MLCKRCWMGLVELLFGVAGGCMISIFVYKRGLSSKEVLNSDFLKLAF